MYLVSCKGDFESSTNQTLSPYNFCIQNSNKVCFGALNILFWIFDKIQLLNECQCKITVYKWSLK